MEFYLGKKIAIDGGSLVATDDIPVGMHGLSVIDEQEINAGTKVSESQSLLINKRRIKCHCFLYRTG